MRHRFFDLAFTPGVRAEQARMGCREAYADAVAAAAMPAEALTDREVSFIADRDSVYLASVSETGWPYVQHRGGPIGFVKPIDDRTIGWAEFAGNRQYVSIGNLAMNDRVAMLFMDYPNRRRLKLLGRLHVVACGERPDLATSLATPGYRARVERFVLVTVEAFDWNCPQHITPRFSEAEIAIAVAPLHARIAELEAQLAKRPTAIA